MSEYKKAIASYFKEEKQLKLFAVYDGGDRYLFGMKNPKLKEEPLDPWYTINKKTKKIEGFHPYDDWDFFEKSLKNKLELARW